MLRPIEWEERRDYREITEFVWVTATFINNEWHFQEKESWDVRAFPVPSTPALLNNLAIVLSHLSHPGQPLIDPVVRLEPSTCTLPGKALIL